MHKESDLDHIAIVGMAGSFPGADNVTEFWHNLVAGKDSITFLSDEELLQAGVDKQLLGHPQYVKACSALHDIALFDANFFHMTPEEAQITDPQHRLLLETAYTALEDAACRLDDYAQRIGVFASVGISHYLLHHLLSAPDLLATVGLMPILLGNDKSYACTRISHKLNLTGPSMSIDTACSSSLVAIAQAVKSLLAYECDVALAGGAKINVPHKTGYLWSKDSFLSPDGRCRAFDADAKGIIFGSGVGMLVLKRLVDAKDDHIYAVIKGVAVNNDGAHKMSYTAPSMTGQTSVIAEALAIANTPPESISYIETHGTGTALGDPLEIAALTEVFAATTPQTSFCAIGSLKTNIGYLEVASGVAGVIKTALALKHQQIPASLHYTTSNPAIDFAQSPFYVNTKLCAWHTPALPRRAGVSSFGIGGTNAHIVLEEAPALGREPSRRAYHVLLLSAKTLTALEQATINLANYLQANLHVNCADVAYTLQSGRTAYNYRRIIVCQHVAQAIQLLRSQDANSGLTHHYQPHNAPHHFSIPSMMSFNPEEDKKLAFTLGSLWLRGAPIQWADYYSAEKRGKLSLPTYPFERQRHWLEGKHNTAVSSAVSSPIPTNSRKIQVNYVAPRTKLQQNLAHLWQQHLKLDRVGIEDNFFDLGGNSLAVMAVIGAAAAIGIEIKPMQLFRYPTIAALTTSLAADFSDTDKTHLELLPEVALPFELNLHLPRASTPARHLFLTGATGFVGAFLLQQLLKEFRSADIYCLVRAKDEKEARHKLQANLAHYGLWQPEFNSRIKPIIGNLEQPLLGMSAEVFAHLADLIELIIHCGAVVNFVSSYEQLKPANILGTVEILKLASQKTIKPVHYISTVSVFPKPEYVPNQLALENDTLDFAASYKGGYAQTKWVAEKIVLLAKNLGLPVTIYRLGRITGCSQTGAWNTSDFLCKMIKGCIQLGLVPQTNYTIDFTPVDYVSQAIVHIIKSPKLREKTYHLVHPQFTCVQQLVGYVKELGYSLQEVPYQEWYQALLHSVEQHTENALQVVIDLFEPSSEADPWEENILATDCSNLTAALKDSAITCPAIDKLLPVYFAYLRASNFIKKINY